jgi:hypothetical protein
VERNLGCLILHRRLAWDYETLPERSQPMIHWATIDNVSRTPARANTQTWRDLIPGNEQTTH